MSSEEIDREAANEECVGPSSESAGKASGCEGCPNQKACAEGKGREEDPELELIKQRLSGDAPLELIAVVDGATDGSLPFLRALAVARGPAARVEACAEACAIDSASSASLQAC